MPAPAQYNRFSGYQRSAAQDAVVQLTGAVQGTAAAAAGQDTSAATSLTPVLATPGSFGSASLSVNLKVNSAGQVVEVGESTITADGLSNAVTISATGDAAWSVSFDGKANVTSAITLATVNANVGTFGDSTHVSQIAVGAKGLITAASSVAIAFPITSFNTRTGAITLTSGDVTTALGYTPGHSNIAVTFGTGAPAGSGVTDGDLYFDDTLATYAGYVWRSAAWHAF